MYNYDKFDKEELQYEIAKNNAFDDNFQLYFNKAKLALKQNTMTKEAWSMLKNTGYILTSAKRAILRKAENMARDDGFSKYY